MVFNEMLELSIEEAIHFEIHEVRCKGGCDHAQVQPKLVWILQSARTRANIPFHITSWHRCVNYNKYVGGTKNSSHLRGWAVDILLTKNKLHNYKILEALLFYEVPRIKVHKDYIHIDIDPEKRWWILL